MKNIFLDIETTGLLPWYGNRITCICAKDDVGRFSAINEDECTILKSFNAWMAEHAIDQYQLVTKNGKQFDIPFIATRAVLLHFTSDVFISLLAYTHFDMHEVTKKWVSLDDMARLLSCQLKSGTGLQAINLWKEKKYEELLAYCQVGVDVLEEVYQKYTALKKNFIYGTPIELQASKR